MQRTHSDCNYTPEKQQQHQQSTSTNSFKQTEVKMKSSGSFTLITRDKEVPPKEGFYNAGCQIANVSEPYTEDISSNSDLRKISVQVQPKPPPPDKWNAVQIILVIQGVATVMPWNMFINAKSYFEDYKLTNNGTDGDAANYKNNFMSYITVCSMVPSVIFSILNTFVNSSSGPSQFRIIFSKCIMIIVLALTILLAYLDSSSWTATFFIVTLCSVVVINAATSVFQNNLIGLSSVLPGKYISLIFIGANSCGILTSLSQIISIAISSELQISAIIYFSVGIVTLILSLITNHIFQKLPFYLYYRNQTLEQTPKTTENGRPEYFTIFKKVWKMCFTIWFTFSTTIVNFPNTTSYVQRFNFPMNDTYWIPVMCFLNFNVFALLGTIPSIWLQCPSVKYLWIVALIRGIFFLPFFMFCNYLPESRTFPVYFSNDIVYIIAVAVLALTNAHLTTLAFQYGPTLLEKNEVVIGGMMLNIFLYAGILTGGFLSFSYPLIVKNVGSLNSTVIVN